MFSTTLSKKRVAGVVLLAIIVGLFFAFNRFPKLDAVGGDLDIVSSAAEQCFQGFCIEREAGTGLLEQWWGFFVDLPAAGGHRHGLRFRCSWVGGSLFVPIGKWRWACVRGSIQENSKGPGGRPGDEPVFGVYRPGVNCLSPSGCGDRRDHRDGAKFRHHEYSRLGHGVLCFHAYAGIQPTVPGNNWGRYCWDPSWRWRYGGAKEM